MTEAQLQRQMAKFDQVVKAIEELAAQIAKMETCMRRFREDFVLMRDELRTHRRQS